MRAFQMDNVMTMRKWAGEENADLKKVQLPGDPCPKEYTLVNEEGFLHLLENINRKNRYIFDFAEINALLEKYNERDDFREFLKALPPVNIDPNMSGDEDSDYSSDSDFDFDKEAKIDEIIKRLDSHNERIDKLIKMLKPNKNNNFETIDEDDEKMARIRVKQ